MSCDRFAVLDNGAHRIKYGWAGEECPMGSMPNCVAKINKTMQVFVGDDIDSIPNTSQLLFSRPCDRGMLVNWNTERDIWAKIFDATHLSTPPQDCGLVMTIPPFFPDELQHDTNEILFEEFGFQSALCRPAPWFSSYEHFYSHNPSSIQQPGHVRPSIRSKSIPAAASFQQQVGTKSSGDLAATQDILNMATEITGNCIVVDSGFSFTHILPFIDGKCVRHAARRVNIGGKLLTNYLKEIISYRQWNVMDEYLLINQVKESLCFVSNNFEADLTECYKLKGEMTISKDIAYGSSRNFDNSVSFECDMQDDAHVDGDNDIDGGGDEEEEENIEYLRKFFVMPDFLTILKGFVKEEGEAFSEKEQVLTMESERFSVPELLFRPTDIGLAQAGVTEATGQLLSRLHDMEVGLCVPHIILTGGNVSMPNFRQRYEREVRPFVPSHWGDAFQVHLPQNPVEFAWRGASHFVIAEAAAGSLVDQVVTKQEYLEHGHSICTRKFSYW